MSKNRFLSIIQIISSLTNVTIWYQKYQNKPLHYSYSFTILAIRCIGKTYSGEIFMKYIRTFYLFICLLSFTSHIFSMGLLKFFFTSDSIIAGYGRNYARAQMMDRVEEKVGFRPAFSENELLRNTATSFSKAFREEEKKRELEEYTLLRERQKNELCAIIRARKEDCTIIARNIGWENNTKAVERIKQHVFHSPIEPTLLTVEIWERLYHNNFLNADREWIEEKFLELRLDEET